MVFMAGKSLSFRPSLQPVAPHTLSHLILESTNDVIYAETTLNLFSILSFQKSFE